MLALRERLLLIMVLLGAAGLGLAWLWGWPIGASPTTLVQQLGQGPRGWLGLAVPLALWLLSAWWAVRWALRPLSQLVRNLENTVLSYRDGDFSMAMRPAARGELRQLTQLHHDLGVALRAQRKQLAQRELLLDTVVQHTPVALLLVDAGGTVVYANLGARHLLAAGRSLAGLAWSDVLATQAPELAQALQQGQDQLVTVDEQASGSGEPESYHLSQRPLSLLGQAHQLVLVRRLTRELSRQEVASWKRVIRVLSHELNNSLAPISSMAHSAAELCRRGQTARAVDVLERISQRAQDLHGFLAGYASVAKLPLPRPEPFTWSSWVDALREHTVFALDAPLPTEEACLDRAQLTQACLNLLKNAHESGSPPGEVRLSVQREGAFWLIRVDDHGPGMSEAVLAQALLPFYSTKRSGTGLGLALVREIAEAHGGRVQLANRQERGLRVQMFLSAQLRPAG